MTTLSQQISDAHKVLDAMGMSKLNEWGGDAEVATRIYWAWNRIRELEGELWRTKERLAGREIALAWANKALDTSEELVNRLMPSDTLEGFNR